MCYLVNLEEVHPCGHGPDQDVGNTSTEPPELGSQSQSVGSRRQPPSWPLNSANWFWPGFQHYVNAALLILFLWSNFGFMLYFGNFKHMLSLGPITQKWPTHDRSCVIYMFTKLLPSLGYSEANLEHRVFTCQHIRVKYKIPFSETKSQYLSLMIKR